MSKFSRKLKLNFQTEDQDMNKLEAQEPGETMGFSAFHHCDKIPK
jgi:hypothetical protein